MFPIFSLPPRLRMALTKLGSLLLMFQRAPLIRMLFPEARFLVSSSVGTITTWTATAVAGLGAYDTVAGATTNVTQITPAAGSTTVPTAVGSVLSFTFHTTGVYTNPMSWRVSGTLPPGTVHADAKSATDAISGVLTAAAAPTQITTYPVAITAWQTSTYSGFSSPTQTFNIVVNPNPVITTQPSSVTIPSGTAPSFTVVGNVANGSNLTYQWFRGNSGTTTSLIAGATSATYSPGALTATSSYWVRVTRVVGGVGVPAFSNTVTATIGSPPAFTTSPASVTIASGATATLTAAASGTPNFQWYRGAAGDTTNPVSGATAASFTTPALTQTTTFWVRATNSSGQADSAAATVTVTQPDPVAEWKAAKFTTAQLGDANVSGDDADPDSDGIKNSDEYLFGTNPLTADAAPLAIVNSGSQLTVSFSAKQAAGAGYSGKTRHYALQSRAELATGAWTAVTGFEDVTGADQVVSTTLAAPAGGSHVFYRLSVTLSP